MPQIKNKIENRQNSWAVYKRFRIGDTCEHQEISYINITGGNGEPGISGDWKKTDSDGVELDNSLVSTEAGKALDSRQGPVITGLIDQGDANTLQSSKDYTDGLINGVKWKDAVDLLAATNITLSGEQTIDGVLTNASRVAVIGNTDKTENGLYITSSGAWTRTADADTGAELVAATFKVLDGTTYQNKEFTNSNSSITLGTTEITFVDRGSSTDHNSTTGKQGGQSGEYYHLNQDKYDRVGNLPVNTNTELGLKANEAEVEKKANKVQTINGSETSDKYASVPALEGRYAKNIDISDSNNLLIGSLSDIVQKRPEFRSISLKPISANSLDISLNFNSQGIQYIIEKDPDGFALIKEVNSGILVDLVKITPELSGTGFVTSLDNSYTTNIGDKLIFNFTGTGFKFYHYEETRGGLWRFTLLETGDTQDISTYGSSSGVYEDIVFSNLDEGNYNVEAEFLGDDPLNPPSSSPSRGWFRYNTSNPITFLSLKENEGVVESDTNLVSGTITEFAIIAKRNDDPNSYALRWIPSHSGSTYEAARDISYKVFYDNKEYIIADFTEVDKSIGIQKFEIEQKYTAYNDNDQNGDYPLWDGVLRHVFEDGKLELRHNISFLYEDVDLGNTYLSQFGIKADVFSELYYNNNSNPLQPIPTASETIEFPEFERAALFRNDNYNAIIEVNLRKTLGITRDNIKENNAEVFLTKRTDGISKLYYGYADAQKTILKGSKISNITTFNIFKK